EEVHRIELELVAQAHIGLHAAQVLIGGDVGNDIDNQLTAFFFRHDCRGCQVRKRLMMRVELIPNIPKELFRIASTRLTERGWLMTRPGISHWGSSSSTLIVG